MEQSSGTHPRDREIDYCVVCGKQLDKQNEPWYIIDMHGAVMCRDCMIESKR